MQSSRTHTPVPQRVSVLRCSSRRSKAPPCKSSVNSEVPSKGSITLLDYGAGNIRSIKNAIRKLGYSIHEVGSIRDIETATRLVFPGVGAFGQAMRALEVKGYDGALREYLGLCAAGEGNRGDGNDEERRFFGICIGMQVLFEESEEGAGGRGLGVVPGVVGRFDEKYGIQVGFHY